MISAQPDDLATKTRGVAARLDEVYGRRRWVRHRDPLSELIATILSQNTSDTNSHRAYHSLTERFPTWEAAMAAPESQIADAIKGGGLAEVKARRIKDAIHYVEHAFPDGHLDVLRNRSVPGARNALTSIPGVGPKTASCVLLFSLGMPALPVDTHVFRVASRIGLLPPRINPDKAHEILENSVGNETDAVYSFHMNAIAHGRTVCHARNPGCDTCQLSDICDYFGKESARGTQDEQECQRRKPGLPHRSLD